MHPTLFLFLILALYPRGLPHPLPLLFTALRGLVWVALRLPFKFCLPRSPRSLFLNIEK
jgi:hypothetical protein